MEDVKDMNRTTKEMIGDYLTDQTEKFDLVHLAFFQTLSQHMAEYRGIDYEAQGDPGFHKTMESYVYE